MGGTVLQSDQILFFTCFLMRLPVTRVRLSLGVTFELVSTVYIVLSALTFASHKLIVVIIVIIMLNGSHNSE